jgi:hypothetical protein
LQGGYCLIGREQWRNDAFKLDCGRVSTFSEEFYFSNRGLLERVVSWRAMEWQGGSTH